MSLLVIFVKHDYLNKLWYLITSTNFDTSLILDLHIRSGNQEAYMYKTQTSVDYVRERYILDISFDKCGSIVR